MYKGFKKFEWKEITYLWSTTFLDQYNKKNQLKYVQVLY